MKQSGIFDQVQFLQSRMDRLEVIILEQDAIIRSLRLGASQDAPQKVEPGTRTMMAIASEVASDNGLTLAELRSHSREHAIAHPRQYAFLLMQQAGFSAARIGRFFDRDHTTILHGIAAVRARMAKNGEGRAG